MIVRVSEKGEVADIELVFFLLTIGRFAID